MLEGKDGADIPGLYAVTVTLRVEVHFFFEFVSYRN